MSLLFEGVGGVHGDGDIFKEDNQEAFAKFVRDCTDGKGVHFCMADGVRSWCAKKQGSLCHLHLLFLPSIMDTPFVEGYTTVCAYMIDHLEQFLQRDTPGVHFRMADGVRTSCVKVQGSLCHLHLLLLPSSMDTPFVEGYTTECAYMIGHSEQLFKETFSVCINSLRKSGSRSVTGCGKGVATLLISTIACSIFVCPRNSMAATVLVWGF